MYRTLILGALAVLTGCAASNKHFTPNTKYAPAVLQRDYAIYRETLEEAHPGLYWYTSRDSMDMYFERGAQLLKDSMTEREFRQVLNYVTSKVNCGHTSIRASKKYERFADTARPGPIFPLSLKFWDDSVIVSSNLNRRDSILRRGTPVTAINGVPLKTIVDSLFNYIPTDGYNTTHKFQMLSNRGFFGPLYISAFGASPFYEIEYVDSVGDRRKTIIRPFVPIIDSATRAAMRQANREPQPSRRQRKAMRRNNVRLLKIDSTTKVAMMDLNSFGRGYGLKGFFRRSFRTLKKNKIEHLIIDVRGNGGGSVTNSTMITRFLSDHKFKVGDSLYAVAKRKRYGQYIQNDFWNRAFISFFAKKRKDGYYHFGYFERHHFKPRKNNHFDGKSYILLGGNSFSATTLFASALRDQENVILLGEETGGGAYGNSAWLIPDVTLPGTKVRFRLPLFRLVINKDYPKNGRGVEPEVFSGPTSDAIRDARDYKLEKALELIRLDKEKKKSP